MNLRQPVPLWLFLVGLLTVSSVAAGLAFLPPLLNPKDFAISLAPSQQTLIAQPGQGTGSVVNLKSLHGFIGKVSLKSVTPRTLTCHSAELEAPTGIYFSAPTTPSLG